MTSDVRHNLHHERGDDVLFTIDGRDPAWTNRVMSQLWAHATKLNLTPVLWRVGFYNLRDVLHARDPHFRSRPYSTVRLESVWGADIQVITLGDAIELVAADESTRTLTTIVPGVS